jgi:hypothetical protein
VSQGSRRKTETRGSPWDRWTVLWGAFFYVVLGYAMFNALFYGSPSGTRIALGLVLATALGLWYAYWLLARINPPSDVVYSLGAAGLWVALIAVDPDFIIVGLGIFAPLCLQDLRWAAPAPWLWAEDGCGFSGSSMEASRGRPSSAYHCSRLSACLL